MAATWTLLASNFASAAATTITVTATLTAGRALHIGVISDDATVSSVADTLSNGYTEQGSVIEAAILRRLHNITSVPSTGGSTTITATFAASVANRQIVVYEGTGTSTYDAQGTQTDTGNNPTGNVTATNSAQPASVHAVSFFYQGGTPTVGTGYSDSGLAFSGSGMLLARGEYKSVSSIGSQSANFGNATLDRQCSIMAIFLEPAPPAFTVQPVQQTAASGGTAVFATTVTGATSYQWQEQVSGAWASVATGSGGTTDTYTTATLSSTDNGRRLRLLATNAAGTTGSAEVFLFLTGQPITGKGRQGRGSAWWQRSIAEAGACSGLKAALLRKSPMRGPNFDDADFIAAWNNWYFPAAAGGGGTAVGLATEADTAFALAGLQIRALGLSTETDTALALTVAVARATGLAVETDTAFALARVQIRATGLATETDTALALGGVAIRAVGLAVETDTAQALAAVQVRATGRADEADTALALAGVQLRATGRADETDTAFALTPGAGGTAAGMATEADSAFALAGVQIKALGRSDETDTALALGAVSVRGTGLASESDTAFARAAVQSLLAGMSVETDSAFALAAGGSAAVGMAIEFDTAFALSSPSSALRSKFVPYLRRRRR